MRINNNLMAMNTHRQLGVATNAGAKSMEKLSSGFRINRAGDDAAGLAISEKMRGQIRGLNQASSNAQDGISLIQTAEGALNETHAILQRMRELAVQSSTDTNTNDDRAEIQKEIKQLSTEITRISTDTEFNTKKLLTGNLGGKVDQDASATTAYKLGVASITTSGAKAGTYAITADTTAHTLTMTYDGKTQTIANAGGAQELNFSSFGITMKTNGAYVQDAGVGNVIVTADDSLTFHVGANTDQSVELSIGNMGADTDGLNVEDVDVSTQAAANTGITTIQAAIDAVSSERSKLGAMQNRLEHTIKNLDTSSENLQASEARIRDVDMAKEMMEQTKQNILSQASTAMLAQANAAPQAVLELLR